MDYQTAGVDIRGADKIKKEIARIARSTCNKNVLSGVGHFGALYDLGDGRYLVLSVDGVGTKLEIAQQWGDCTSIGIDLVNHCVNDILCLGAEPLFFLDYLAQDKLREKEVIQILQGITSACLEAKISLIGGELATMPGFYLEGKSDIVGFIAGVVEKSRVVDGSKIRPGDKIIGLLSNGPHTNGYSLIRKIFFEKFSWLPRHFWRLRIDELGCSLGQALLSPHKSYLKPLSLLFSKPIDLHGIAHITGGGMGGNIIRILPDDSQAMIHLGSWPVLPIFRYIQKEGEISSEAMYRVFNMGIGMVLVVSRETYGMAQYFLWQNYQPCYLIGQIVEGEKRVKFYPRGEGGRERF